MSKQINNLWGEKGSMMVEALAMLGLITMVTPILYKKAAERTTELQDINTAAQMRTLSKALDDYIQDNYAELAKDTEGEYVTVLTPEEQAYIIGTQANIWGEYIQTPEHFEYMAFPRLLAMAEVQWTQPEQKDFKDFARRLDKEFRRLDLRGVNACRNFYEVDASGAWKKTDGIYEVDLHTFCPDAEIRYALNDSVVTATSPLYESPIALTEDAVVYAAAYRDGKPLGQVKPTTFAVNAATGCTYSYSETPSLGDLCDIHSLTDGHRGQARDHHRWLTFHRDTMQLVLKLHQPEKISEVSFASLWRPWNTLWPVRAARVSVSMNGEHFVSVTDSLLTYDFSPTEAVRFPVSLFFPEVEAAFVRLELVGGGPCPKGYYNEGKPSDFALDEIEIR